MTFALLAIGLSVLMHVFWNLLARHTDPRSNFLWWGVAGHLLLLGPWAVWRLVQDAQWNPTLVWAMLVTGCANAAYFIGLRGAYRRAPVALVYPIARSSPLLIAVWSVLFFDETLSAMGWAGILVSVVGLVWLGWTARTGESRQALPWAGLAALCTSIYSLSDKVAVSSLPSFGSQLGMVTVCYVFGFTALTLGNLRETGRAAPALRPPWHLLVAGSLCVGTAYALVIHAMKVLPAAYAVTFTNAGLVLATLLSIFAFGERAHWRTRLGAAAVITLGIVFVGLAR